MNIDPTKYPIGTQSFPVLRENDCAYVDKTRHIYELTHSGSRIYFLSRPRRFGKSLLLSTIESYFLGRKELFEGLAIYDMETDWVAYPVIRIDMSSAQAYDTCLLDGYLRHILTQYADKYGVTTDFDRLGVGAAFGDIIKSVHERTGKRVVVLIDEYDKGIIETLDDNGSLTANQNMLRAFFSQLKAQDDHIQFAMLTGVSRFRHLTIFSGFNNPDDISLSAMYADICGFTKDEILSLFGHGIEALSVSLGLDIGETVEQMRLRYDGYRFSHTDVKVFNPFSILNCLKEGRLTNYWLKSGTSKVFLDYLSQSKFDLTDIEDLWVTASRMEGTYSSDDSVPLLFQTGYLTITDYDDGLYRLDIPNGEVRDALVHDLVPYYMDLTESKLDISLMKLRRMINVGDIDGMLTLLQSMMASIPYQEMDIKSQEKTYHLTIYLVFLMLGIDARCEIAMSGGRIDMVARTNKYIYVMEFKLGSTPEDALKQIDDRGYAIPWKADGRHVYKIGINFSPKMRTIEGWVVSNEN